VLDHSRSGAVNSGPTSGASVATITAIEITAATITGIAARNLIVGECGIDDRERPKVTNASSAAVRPGRTIESAVGVRVTARFGGATTFSGVDLKSASFDGG
jgi:hypothetical protein